MDCVSYTLYYYYERMYHTNVHPQDLKNDFSSQQMQQRTNEKAGANSKCPKC